MARTKPHSRLAPFARVARRAPRLLFAGVAAAAIVGGIVGGCGLDYVGSLVLDGGLDATENVGANLPEGSAGDGMASTDGGLDGDAASGPSCTDSRCVDAGGECDLTKNECTFHCDGGTNCDAGLTCPPGVACRVVCAADNVCQGVIDCTKASSCDVECLGDKTCKGVECAGSKCNVACDGVDSCQGAVGCEAGTCTIGCRADGGKMNCKDLVTCESAVACSVDCNADGCPGGVLAVAPDASIHCGDNACAGGPGETCRADFCELSCKSGPCLKKECCEAGVCIIQDGGTCGP